MIAGLPVGTWTLMAFAVVPGIALVTLAYRVHRRGDERAAEQRADSGSSAGNAGGGANRGRRTDEVPGTGAADRPQAPP